MTSTEAAGSAKGPLTVLPPMPPTSAHDSTQAPCNLLPKALADRTQRGEFIDFSSLLPDVVGSNAPRSTPQAFALQLRSSSNSGVPAFEVVEIDTSANSIVRCGVHDLPPWVESLSLHMHAVLSVATYCMPKFVANQARIVTLL